MARAGLPGKDEGRERGDFGRGDEEPQITGPGLAGPGFYNSQGGCAVRE